MTDEEYSMLSGKEYVVNGYDNTPQLTALVEYLRMLCKKWGVSENSIDTQPTEYLTKDQ